MSAPIIRFRNLNFAYEGPRETPSEVHPVFKDFSLEVPNASRTLLIGANGVGKSTLMRLIAGHHLLPEPVLHVLGASPFYDTSIAARVALVDGEFPVRVDLRVQELLDHTSQGSDPRAERELLELLAVDPGWRMHRVSDGQRRRVQLLLALRRPVKLLLLDEVTANLDVVARADLIRWLKQKNRAEGLSILYATHIPDGLWLDPKDPWPTHICFMSFREPPRLRAVSEIAELGASTSLSPLLSVCEDWIRRDSC